MKVEKCNSVDKPETNPVGISYKEAMSKEGIYQFVGFDTHHLIVFNPNTSDNHMPPCGLVLYEPRGENERFLSGQTTEAMHNCYRFIFTNKKICFELKD